MVWRRLLLIVGLIAVIAPLAMTARAVEQPAGRHWFAEAIQDQPNGLHAPISSYRVINAYPHDIEAFTQGLIYVDGVLYEGTGQYGESTLRRVDLETGAVEQMIELDDRYFGEGITLVGDRIYQLTWQEFTAFAYDRETFELLETFTYATAGWGLTTDDQGQLIMSDGSDWLYFRDPETFERLGYVEVTDGGIPIPYLNELEWVDGEVWANVYLTDWIVRIDPATGKVVGWIDLTGLLPEEDHHSRLGPLNGIAYDDERGRLFVTGKRWPTLFEIELIDLEDAGS
jgi:glutaminyl-peptide cyclotransferase